jgi:hypothetical protein
VYVVSKEISTSGVATILESMDCKRKRKSETCGTARKEVREGPGSEENDCGVYDSEEELSFLLSTRLILLYRKLLRLILDLYAPTLKFGSSL